MSKEHRSRRSLVLARKRFETQQTPSQSSEQSTEDPIAILIATERTVEETSSSCSTSTDDGMGSMGKEQSNSEIVDEANQAVSGHFSQQRHSSFPQQKRKALRRKRSESSDTPYRGDEAALSDESGYAEEHTVPKEAAQVRPFPCAHVQVTNL